ncbi:hypothetical protein [Puia sp.]|jgi:hypothetical protein|uniref:hypothetical protein n=1 Tax=Puia sp. TaxID=2045100 RepID=UPI002F417378
MKIHCHYILFSGFCAALCWLTGCQKHLNVKEVISLHASSDQLLADGSAKDILYADLPIATLASLRGVTFKASSGLFDNGADTMSVFANRTDVTVNKITASVVLHASLRSGPDTVSASTSTVPQQTDFVYLTLNPSSPATIQLTPLFLQLTNVFGMQVAFTGLLQNADGGMVSQGVKVKFIDQAEDNPTLPKGVFSPQVAVLDTASVVSTTYYPPLLPAGSAGVYIVITAIILDASDQPTNMTATARIFISPS